MNESVLELLIYLFEHYLDGESILGADEGVLRVELARLGFTEAAVERALLWLDEMAAEGKPAGVIGSGAIRVFGDDEEDRLDVAARGYLLSLEQAGLLDADRRELVIDRLMALESDDVDLDQVRWVVRMVLFHRPDRGSTGRDFEGLVLDQTAGVLH